MANWKDDAKQAELAERRDMVVKLRTAGKLWKEIAAELGCAPSMAYNDFARAIKERPAESVDAYRAVADDRLQAIFEGHLEAARTGDSRAAMVVIRAIETHAKIFGYAAAERHEHTVAPDTTPAEAKRLMREFFGGHVQVADGPRIDTITVEVGPEDVRGPSEVPPAN